MIACSILITIALNISNLESVDCSSSSSNNGKGPTSNFSVDCNSTATFDDQMIPTHCKSDEEIVSDGAGIFAIVATLVFVVFFALGPGSIPWLITGELFTQSPRSAAIAIATFVNWTGNLVVGLVFPQMQERITNFSFLPFTVALILLFLALFYYLPETKGMAVNDVEGLFQVSKPFDIFYFTFFTGAIFQIRNAWKRPIGLTNKTLMSEMKEKSATGQINYGSTDQSK